MIGFYFGWTVFVVTAPVLFILLAWDIEMCCLWVRTQCPLFANLFFYFCLRVFFTPLARLPNMLHLLGFNISCLQFTCIMQYDIVCWYTLVFLFVWYAFAFLCS